MEAGEFRRTLGFLARQFLFGPQGGEPWGRMLPRDELADGNFIERCHATKQSRKNGCAPAVFLGTVGGNPI